MRCQECFSIFPKPDILDNVAYFVCEKCGNLFEKEGYEILNESQRIERFEKENNLKFPKEFISFQNSDQTWVTRLPPADTKVLKHYFGSGFYVFNSLFRFEEDETSSVLYSFSDAKEWGLPESILPIDGDGHTWLALDYRSDRIIPTVIVIESDFCESLEVAKNFRDFINGVLPYESVYNYDGEVILGEDVD